MPVPAPAPAAVTPAPRPAPGLPPRPGALPQPAGSPGRTKWGTLAVLCLSLLVIVVDRTIVNVALPTLARQLHASTSGLQWIVDAYTLSFAALLLLAGALGRPVRAALRAHRRAALFGAGRFGAALSRRRRPNSSPPGRSWVWARRSSCPPPCPYSPACSPIRPSAPRPSASGPRSAAWAWPSGPPSAAGSSPTSPGTRSSSSTCRVVAVALGAGRWLIPASRGPGEPRRLDLVGAGMAAVTAFAMLTYAFIQAPAGGWTSSATLLHASAGRSACSPRSSCGRCAARHPMLPLALLRNPRFSGRRGSPSCCCSSR